MSRIALIIGNADYPDSPLVNPVNDAQAIREKLDRLGFHALIRTNAQNVAMEKGLNKFSAKLDSSEAALFFFAGHGMQIKGENYLTAVDTNFADETDAKHSSLSLNKVIEKMERGSNRINMIILDACRNNPYERRWRGTESRGLAAVYAPRGMIIAYATSPGQVAADGDGKNGAYTDALLRHISTPDITIEDLFKRVRNTLSSSTGGRQISREHTSLMGDFYFNYSAVSNELVAEYSDNARADSHYRPSSLDVVQEILEALQSLNWHQQNRAITRIKPTNLEKFNKEDLFVLGRNIYQAACGEAWKAEDYLENLQTSLNALEDKTHFHVLNGILFEIYFDSGGRFRSNPKSTKIDPVFKIEETEHFHESFKFIRSALRSYLKNLFYVPSSTKGISVDVSCVDYEDDVAVDGIFFEGNNVLYADSGEGYYDLKRDRFMTRKTSRNEMKEALSRAMVVPTSKLKVNFLNLENETESILSPIEMKIKKLSN